MPNNFSILFDLDGTVFDTAPEFLYCLNKLLSQHKKPLLTLEALRAQVSNGGDAMLKLAFGLTPQDPEYTAIKTAFLDTYENNLGVKCQPFDGILTLLTTLDNAQIPWGIVTNKPSRFAYPTLEKFGLMDRANAIVCADQVKQPKPSPEALLLACEQLHSAPEYCWYVGDSKIDVIASQSAGIPVAIAEYGYFPANTDIQSWGADFYFADPRELIPHFKELAGQQ